MKRILAIMLAVVIAIALSGFASAEGNTYRIEEYGITLEIPDKYLVITPDSIPDEDALAGLGMTREDIIDMFNIMPLYLDAALPDLSSEITLTIQDSDMPDYRELGATTLELFMPEITGVYSQFDTEVLTSDIYSHAQMPFMRVYFAASPYAQGGVLYSTVLDGKSYTLTMHSEADTLSEEDDALMQSVVDSLRFEALPLMAALESEPIAYTEESFGISFTVPAGWQHEEVKQKPPAKTAVFTAVNDPAANIVFVAADIWNELSATEKIFTTRSKIDNSYLSYSEVAEMVGASYSDVEHVNIAGNEYYKVPFEQKVSQNGLNLSVRSTALICVRDSITYMFLYTGSGNNGLYADFEELIASVSYADPLEGGIAPIVYILIAAAVIAVSIIILTSISKKKKRRLAEEAEAATRRLREEAYKAEMEARKAEEAARKAEEAAKFIPCPKCGAKIERANAFCGFCGEKIIVAGESEE